MSKLKAVKSQEPFPANYVPPPAAQPLPTEPDALPAGHTEPVFQADATTLACHKQCQRVGRHFQKLKNVFEKHQDYILAMRRNFHYKNGYRGRAISDLPGFLDPVFFPEYVKETYGCTMHELNHYFRLANERYEKPTPKPLEERPDFKKGFSAGRVKAENEFLAKNADLHGKIPDLTPAIPPATPPPITQVLTAGERDHIAAVSSRNAKVIAEEVYATFAEDRAMSSFEITQVINELTLLNKPTIKPMPNRFATNAVAAQA
jgi:hypothetical protein